ncbi:NAD(P)-dependent alcohol dehydrogenase [Aurantibacillus circumpalustris]|uniref:NAD(P)-dependent alcohol dehydrogenase n=1 Tax=Aurantibacillus circumpalustris TaxID=3036359 RepID=UPI00295BDE8A|nr:NAD(P)-dependent alcohol dehydrogenase [Aurantibacillus circumpalustris]
MKAIVNTVYGSPDVLSLREVEKPIPKDNEVLIKIHSSTVNRTDCGFRKPEYFIVRLFSGIFKPKNTILGNELVGEVEAIGKNVSKFKTGDAIFGLSTWKFGTHAEYICMAETASIATKPTNMTFDEATAVCDGMMLAMNMIRQIDFSSPKKILINGATGSIGTACVQLAKFYGAEITAVGNTKNLELIKSLGADSVKDYTQEDFTKTSDRFDFVLDAVGKSSFFRCKKILKRKGVYISTELGFLSQNIFLAIFSPLFGGKRVKFPIPTDSQKDILLFKEIIESGKYKAIIDRTYPFDQFLEATRYVESGEKTGNVVLKIVD